jgi:hypothetical protein
MEENQDAHEVLADLLNDWPKTLDEPEVSVRSRLKGRIDDRLPSESLRTVAGGQWNIISPMSNRPDVAKGLISDSSCPDTLVLAEMRFQSARWVLASFDQQCPVCFGSGVNDNRICDLCFGEGWGCH